MTKTPCFRPYRAVLMLALALAFLAGPYPARAAGTHEGHDHDDMFGPGFSPVLSLHGFSDVTFRTERTRFAAASETTSSAFVLGQFDLYFLTKLSANLSFLGETVFELNGAGEGVVDVERVFIKYAWSDRLKIAAGRTHTALGYWNEAFHHGALLQPTVERPEELKFEDDGGILPVHAVGVEVSGGLESGDWSLAYVGNLANGRGATRDAVQGGSDLNRDKAAGIKLTLERSSPIKVEAGPMFYRDRIPAVPGVTGRDREIGERITGGHLHASGRWLEGLTEIYRVRHEDRSTGALHRHDAGYAILMANTGRLDPYAGFERLNFDPGDPFFAPEDRDLDRVTAGLRFEPDPFLALKLEYRNDRRPGERTHALLLQAAFTF